MERPRKTIAVMGAGALGGYYGARLQQAGHTVHFIARGAILAALRQDGLRVERDAEQFTLPSVLATDDPQEVGEVDLVVLATKGTGLEAAVQAIAPLVRADTVVLPLLNGMNISERISAVLSRGIVLGGLTYLGANVPQPGVVRQSGDEKPLLLGPLSPEHVEPARATAALFQEAGTHVVLSEDIRKDIWKKYVGVIALAGTQTMSRRALGPVLANQDTLTLLKELLLEGEALAAAAGVGLEPGMTEAFMVLVAQYPPHQKASMLQDLEAGKPIELETIHGAAIRLAEQLGVPVPACQRVYDALKPFAGD